MSKWKKYISNQCVQSTRRQYKTFRVFITVNLPIRMSSCRLYNDSSNSLEFSLTCIVLMNQYI